MTTIAFKDGILAADTQLTLADEVAIKTHKIDVLANGMVVACAGSVDDEYWWKQMIQGAKVPSKKKKFKIEAIVLVDKKCYQCYGDSALIDLGTPFYACGNGRLTAIAAMHMGMTAKQAVQFTGELNIYTNKIVDTYDTKLQKITYGK